MRKPGRQKLDAALTIAKERAAAQRLSAPAAWSPARVVEWLGAMQSQEYPLARWSVAQRVAKKTADVDAAVADGSILRVHILRPTWHFVARDDLRWMQELTAPRTLAQMRYNDRLNGVDAALVGRAIKAITTAIARDGHLTRAEIAGALTRAGIKTNAWLVGQLVIHAEMRAIVCSGAPRGRNQTYALVDERAPRPSTMTRDESLAALAERYFRSHGPATARDYQWWSGLKASDAARGIEMLGRAVERVTAGDRVYLRAAERPAVRPTPGQAHLIQTYDELVVAYSESRDVVDVSGAVRAGGSGAALLTRGIVLDGQIAARWAFAPEGSRALALEPLRRLSSRERAAVAAAAARFERFYFD